MECIQVPLQLPLQIVPAVPVVLVSTKTKMILLEPRVQVIWLLVLLGNIPARLQLLQLTVCAAVAQQENTKHLDHTLVRIATFAQRGLLLTPNYPIAQRVVVRHTKQKMLHHPYNVLLGQLVLLASTDQHHQLLPTEFVQIDKVPSTRVKTLMRVHRARIGPHVRPESMDQHPRRLLTESVQTAKLPSIKAKLIMVVHRVHHGPHVQLVSTQQRHPHWP